MKLEAGKYYKTRNGRKVMILKSDLKNYYEAIGYFLCDDTSNEETIVHWKADGRAFVSNKSSLDIISEWEEQKPRMLAYINLDGFIYFGKEDDKTIFKGGNRAPWLDEPENKSSG